MLEGESWMLEVSLVNIIFKGILYQIKSTVTIQIENLFKTELNHQFEFKSSFQQSLKRN